MNKTLNGAIISIIFFMFLAFVTACSNNTETSNNDNGDKTKPQKEEEKISGELTISTAVSLTDAVEEIKAEFNKLHPDVVINYNFGSSGKLSQQISQGAPADIFLSAGKKDMDALEESDLIVKDSRFDFASNAVVVIGEKNSDIELNSVDDIPTANFSNLAMGHTESTPLGRIAKETFENGGIWSAVESKIVYGSDVRQVLSFVEQGNAQLGVLYMTDAITSDKVKVLLEVDPSLHSPVIYPASIVKNSTNQEAANEYLQFLKSDQGRAILESHGFVVK